MRTCYGINGPINMCDLPETIRNKFIREDNLEWISMGSYIDGRNSTSIYQVPNICHQFMKRINETWESKWSNEMIQFMLKHCETNIGDLSPSHYPLASLQIYEALNKFSNLSGKHVAVMGSISPWIEVLAIYCGAKSVCTIEYSTIEIESPLITYINVNDLIGKKFDVVISFSSLEHDGLGRYGDPINPEGDIEAVCEIYEMLNEGGIFICGFPVGRGCIEGNFHRIYNKTRLERMFNKFKKIASIPYPYKEGSKNDFYYDEIFSKNDWQHQPVFILEKTNITESKIF